VTTVAASSRYRSTNDPSLQIHKRFLLVDTPGHGKLRHHAIDSIVKPQHLRGIIYVVDAANISPGSAGLKEAADYLYDVLILLQKSLTTNKLKQVPLLIAANKMDLFTALPAPLVKRVIENELTSVRSSRAKGLLDSGIGMTDVDDGENKDWLGDGGEGNFQFSQLEEFNITVTVSGGNVASTGETDVKEWWEWMGNNL
jgi:signal recognition particle receptor subunit beta